LKGDSPGPIPRYVVWMAVLLPHASTTMLALAGTIGISAVLGYKYHVMSTPAVNALEVVLFTGLVIVIVGLVVMYSVVLSHLRRIRRQAGIDENKGLRPLAAWWKSAGQTRRLSGALGVAAALFGVGIVRSEQWSLVGWSALVVGLLLLLATRFVARRNSIDR